MAVQRRGPGFATLEAALKGLDGLEGKTGWFETNKYPDGTPVAMVALINEEGALTNSSKVAEAYQVGGGGDHPGGARSVYIPARPFMRPAVRKYGKDWMKDLGRGAKAALAGKIAPAAAMEIVTLKAAGDVGRQISETFEPPNAPSTIRRKKKNTPLRDSNLMMQGVTGVVEKTK